MTVSRVVFWITCMMVAFGLLGIIWP